MVPNRVVPSHARTSPPPLGSLRTLALVVAALVGIVAGCGTSTALACLPEDSESSVPRRWVEVTLDAIRRDVPAPTVHARNLWHVSAAMWDAHAVMDPAAAAYFDHGLEWSGDATAEAEATAISWAAHGVLTWRYELAVGGVDSLTDFDALMAELCLDPTAESEPGSPAAVGRAIAEHVIEFGLDDGSAENERHVDLSYVPTNEPLIVADDDIEMADPDRWQPLQLARRITQNGLEQDGGLQTFIGSNWGWVQSFALPAADDAGVTIAVPDPPLYAADRTAYADAAIEVIGYSDLLGGTAGVERIDISPGHDTNPATGEPYPANLVPHADYGRAIAEYWADGPDSETPPGHWNTIAIAVSDRLGDEGLRWAGDGPVLTRHEWDLRLFFTLNAALHDAAIAVWGTKRAWDYPRPISMIRWLAAQGELPDTPGLVETVTAASRADRHVGLPVGATVVRSWLGPPGDPDDEVAGVGWLDAGEWLPYQRPTFVSPAFAGYVSGHSGFSRAAAEILTAATASPWFPGGLLEHEVPAGSLLHEEGPSVDVVLQWATYREAADEAGLSRRYGGIHIAADDLAGRALGAEVAERAWAAAQPVVAPD